MNPTIAEALGELKSRIEAADNDRQEWSALAVRLLPFACHEINCRVLLAGPKAPCTCGLDELRNNPLLK
jgi:hypothetical protein